MQSSSSPLTLRVRGLSAISCQRSARHLCRWMVCALVAMAGVGCDGGDDDDVVTLYCSVDEPFAREVVAVFEAQSDITVRLKPDTEAGKTTQLVRRIEAERNRPQADVFWSSELFNTIKMGRDGLLAQYRPPAEGIPDRYKDSSGRWTAFGLRARVIGYNTTRFNARTCPRPGATSRHHRSTASSAWPTRASARPRGHLAAFLALWGEPEYVTFLQELDSAIDGRLMDGNATAARFVARGELLICATDTDDVYGPAGTG